MTQNAESVGQSPQAPVGTTGDHEPTGEGRADRAGERPAPSQNADYGGHYPPLWHFTCQHGRRALGKRGLLVAPIAHPLLGAKVIWLTTEAEPDRERTGLTMNLQRCDRMAYRYRVLQPERCTPWLGSPFRAVALAVADLESFGDPEHWWVTAVPTLAALSPNDRPGTP